MQDFENEGVLTQVSRSLEKAVRTVLAQINANLTAFEDRFPAPSSRNGLYPAIGNTEWTSSFWTGMIWLAYEWTGLPQYRDAAELQLQSFRQRLEDRVEIATHDLGFLYTLSCVAGYKLTGNEEARQTALKAADFLIARYFPKAGIIQAWGDLNDPAQRGRMIIDCLMNLPLLYWTAEETGVPRYRHIALQHALKAAQYIVREDASTYHTFYMDPETGAPLYGNTHQGFSDDSCWARGQAWGIYGFALNYRYCRDPRFLELSQKLADYFLNRLPDDGICYWDLAFNEGALTEGAFTQGNEERDSSAAAIAVCGMLELSTHLSLDDPSRLTYQKAAHRILESLTRNYLIEEVMSSGGILKHAVYHKPGGIGIDECCIWGDYFYFEALMRVSRQWQLYW